MKKLTIHKKNEMVRGSDDYNLNAKKALNAIYYGLQKNRELGAFKSNTVNFKFSSLRSLMGLEKDNNYVFVMKEALLELQNPFQLNNFFHPEDKVEYHWFSSSFLNSVGFIKKDDGEWIAKIEISSLCKYLMQKDGNFTQLSLVPYLNKFRTKYAMKIYEYLQSFKGYRYLEITHKHLIKLLALDEKSRYQYYSKLKELVERQLKEIKNKSDLTEVKLMNSKILSKEKKFRIMINPKSQKDAKKMEAENILNSLIKRF